MSHCLYVAWPLKLVYDGLKNQVYILPIINTITYPFIALYSGFFGYMKLIFDFLWPIKAIVSFILNSAFSLVWNIVILPYTILMFFYNGALEILTVFKGLMSSF